jgi:hypothetical protein
VICFRYVTVNTLHKDEDDDDDDDEYDYDNNNNNNNKQEFMYRDTTNVEPEMYDYASNIWSHWNSNEKLKEKFGSRTRKTYDRFTTKDSYTWNITHNTESTAV